MSQAGKVSRRDFLKLAGVNLAGLALRGLPAGFGDWAAGWPSLRLSDLPVEIQNILRRVPKTVLMQNGYLHLLDENRFSRGRVPLAPTRWNLERNKVVDELFPDMRWGIVLHWYGDPDYFDRRIKGYLRGFNSTRRIADFETQTSAHFLVGDDLPAVVIDPKADFFGIAQTQAPSPQGVPYLASHLNNFVVRGFAGEHYFINALYQLGLAGPPVNPVLVDLFEGPKVDPNFRTISIEITGSDFDDPGQAPSDQKIANALSVVWAVMERYQIRALDVLGHSEIQPDNADPGKKFMALMRYLLGVKALVEGDARMKYLVFGPFLEEGSLPERAVQRYFEFVRAYLVLVDLPVSVYAWEARSKFWFVMDQIVQAPLALPLISQGCFPIFGETGHPGSCYLDPDNHEGLDIYPVGAENKLDWQQRGAYLAVSGACVAVGENHGFHHGKMAVFRHRQPDGAELLTLYGHLQALAALEVGKVYAAGTRLGEVGSLADGSHAFVHFATAYGATWDVQLRQNPNVPLSADARWVQRHFLPPGEFLRQVVV